MNLAIILIFYVSIISVDVTQIAGKSKIEVESILGQPTSIEQYQPKKELNCLCERTYYLEGKLSIVYIDGKADWITVASDIKVLNLDKARIKEWHNFRKYILIKTFTSKETQCCTNQFS